MEPWWAIMLEVIGGGGLSIVGIARWLWIRHRDKSGKGQDERNQRRE